MAMTLRRLLIAGGFVLAVSAPAFAAATAPSIPLAACPNGEEGDIYTDTCTPFIVPNSPATPAPQLDVTVPTSTQCPAGVTGNQCAGSADGPVSAPQPVIPGGVAPGQPEEELQNVDTPGY